MTRVVAPAKLTVSLAVTGVRPDGYHELRSEMVSLSLADELTFTHGGSGLTVSAEREIRADGLSEGEDNLITRALSAVGRRSRVHVMKRIPLGGGLGGGSTDAAAVLRWADCADLGVALTLGSDVPFSVVGGRALVEGVGEKVTPLAFEQREYLLLLPPFGVNTARVYAKWDELTGSEAPEGEENAREGNALTRAALIVEPRLVPWRDALHDLAGLEPTLAGSGSTWFVEVGPRELTREEPAWLVFGDERARLVRARTVPAGWSGD